MTEVPCWQHEEIREKGWNNLKGNYLKAFLVGVILGLTSDAVTNKLLPEQFSFHSSYFLINILVSIGIGGLIGICKLIITAPLHVGVCAYYLNIPKENNMSTVFSYYTSKTFAHVTIVSILCALKVLLYYLCLIVPGLMKDYEYYFTDYILAENPTLSTKEVQQRSSQLTDGSKLDIFVFELTFIGWFFLGILCCGVGIIFVLPYYYSSRAELYKHMCQLRPMKIFDHENFDSQVLDIAEEK